MSFEQEEAGVMKRLWIHAGRHKKRFGWGILMLLLTNLVAQCMPQLMRLIIDGLETGENVDYLQQLAWLMVGLALAGAVFRTLSRVAIFFSARDVEMAFRNEFFEHLTSQDAGFYQKHPTGDLMSRATNDLGQLRLLLGPGLLNVVNTTIGYSVAIPLMWMISPKITMVILTVYPPALLLMRYLGKLLYTRNREQQERMGDLSAFVQENLAGAHVVRSFGLETVREEKFSKLNEANYSAAVRLAWVRSGMFRMVMTLSSLTVLLGVFTGASLVVDEELSLGDVVAIIEYMALLTWPTLALGWVLSIWKRGAAAMSRLNEILDYEPDIRSGPLKVARLEPSLRVKDLSFSYDATSVLEQVDVDLKPGQTLGVVGPIGSGKSTFVKSLMRLLDIPPETVFVGGTDITELTLASLRRQFGYVSQENILFSRSLAENVAFGRPEASTEDVTTALLRASLDHRDPSIPNGLETIVGERGITLSGGQKQRTAIARALLLDPPILILDDSLSSVDSDTEEAILEQIRKLRKDKTTIIVAHRMTAVAHADEIVVLDDGAITERGTHKTLMETDGLYAGMVKRQELEAGLQ
jgi:ATP-binding cassette, subfamily B, multidrug efflux pump